MQQKVTALKSARLFPCRDIPHGCNAVPGIPELVKPRKWPSQSLCRVQAPRHQTTDQSEVICLFKVPRTPLARFGLRMVTLGCRCTTSQNCHPGGRCFQMQTRASTRAQNDSGLDSLALKPCLQPNEPNPGRTVLGSDACGSRSAKQPGSAETPNASTQATAISTHFRLKGPRYFATAPWHSQEMPEYPYMPVEAFADCASRCI